MALSQGLEDSEDGSVSFTVQAWASFLNAPLHLLGLNHLSTVKHAEILPSSKGMECSGYSVGLRSGRVRIKSPLPH